MAKTVRELINDLTYYPMDAKVVVLINNQESHEIADVTKYSFDDNLYLEIETEQPERDKKLTNLLERWCRKGDHHA